MTASCSVPVEALQAATGTTGTDGLVEAGPDVSVEYTVYSDNNDSQTVQPGETVCLRLDLANASDKLMSNMTVSVTGPDSDVTMLTTGSASLKELQPSGQSSLEFHEGPLCGSYYRYLSLPAHRRAPCSLLRRT